MKKLVNNCHSSIVNVRAGFTLVEMLVAIGIVALLGAGVIANVITQPNKARDSQRVSAVAQIKKALDLYYQDTNCYPTNANFLSGTDWKDAATGTVYMQKMPKDPTSGDPYKYVAASTTCPQWSIVYAPLSATQNTNTCKLPTYVLDGASCVPQGSGLNATTASSWACEGLGDIVCNQPAMTPTLIPTATTAPTATPAPAPTSAPIQLVQDADHDRYYFGGGGPQATTGSQVHANGKTYFKTAASEISNPGDPYIYLAVADALGPNDCNDNNINVYQNISNIATDQDQDGYYTGSALTVCVGGTSSVPVKGGLVASYAMNENTGTTVTDASGFANNAKFGSTFGLVGHWKLNGNGADSSGNGINTSFGNGTWVADPPRYGISGLSAMAFNGSSQYIIIPDNALLNPTKQVTISGWYKINTLLAASGWQQLFFKGSLPDWTPGTAENRQYAMFLGSDGSLALSSAPPGSGVAQVFCQSPAGSVTISQWYYIVGLVNADAGNMQIYVNGQLYASCAFPVGNLRATTGNLFLGRNPTQDFWFFSGSVADFKIYSRALSPYEIQQAYSTTGGGIVGYWQFDEGKGKTANDTSGNLNHGTITNGLLTFLKMDEGMGNTAWDYSQNNLNASINPSAGAGWAADPSYYFNGTASSYGTTGAVSITGDNPWTMSVWAATVTEPPAGQWRAVMTLGGCTQGIRAPLIIRYPGVYTGGFYNGAARSVSAWYNAWNNITVTYTGNQGLVSIYLNGTLMDSGSAAGYPGTADGQMINLARDGVGCGSYGNWNGYLKNVQVYNRALSASEVSNLYLNYLGGASWSLPGRIGVSAYQSGAGKYVSLGTPAALNLPGETSVFAWIKPTSVSSLGVIMGQVGASGYSFNIGRTSGKLEVNWGGQVLPNNSSTATLSPNNWYHVGFVRSGSTGNWTGKLYVNGGSPDKTFTTNINPTAQQITTIGNANGGGLPFEGIIDDVQVYNRALTQAEVNAIYNNSGSPFWDTGQTGTALNFNGLSSIVAAPDSTSLKLGAKQSVAAWVKWNGGGATWQRIVGKGGSKRNYGLWLYPTAAGGWLYQIIDIPLNQACQAQELVVPAVGWTFLVGTYDGATVRLYKNGNNLVAQNSCVMTPPTDTQPLNIGGYGNGNVNTVNGLVDDVKIYKRTLSPAEVNDLHTAGATYKTYYKDASGNFTKITINEAIGSGDTVDTDPLIWAP